MTLTLHIGFYDPFSGAWMTGIRDFWIDSEEEALKIEERYNNYYQETYGNGAEAFWLELKEDE